MRQPRIKVSAAVAEAVYHCMTRTVNGERILDDVAKEVLRKQLWQIADFCGVSLLTYTILSNHFHALVHVPKKTVVDDDELLRRYQVLYPKPTRYQTAQFSVVRAHLAANGPEAEAWRKRQLALMGDVSQFMKLVKQRFTKWFNKTHNRYGTLWSERFKSVLVEPTSHVMQTIAAYIDLNCVRAGLAQDPKDYRFCGYAEAVVGHPRARTGQIFATNAIRWNDAQVRYRQLLFGTGTDPREHHGRIIAQDFQQTAPAGRKTLLRQCPALSDSLFQRWRRVGVESLCRDPARRLSNSDQTT